MFLSEKGKKMIAPIVITAFFILYLILYVVLVIRVAVFEPLLIMLAIPLVLLGGGLVYVLLERLNEIKKGEDDDLSNY
ncbi:MAG: hypothetical protein IKQ24_10090 [Verrucomicrobia bacterium]|nr:hypothetical protein [Lachnospiraceae bacterium]MBR4250490.1 hypothetical protein [Verrucomicrobiota bacterium]